MSTQEREQLLEQRESLVRRMRQATTNVHACKEVVRTGAEGPEQGEGGHGDRSSEGVRAIRQRGGEVGRQQRGSGSTGRTSGGPTRSMADRQTQELSSTGIGGWRG